MIRNFPNDIISSYFKEIRNLLYEADGRTDSPPEDLFDFKSVNILQPEHSLDKDINVDSKIVVLPNKSFLEFKMEVINGPIVTDTFNIYSKDFLELPFDLVNISDSIEIDSYFYYYSELGIEDPATASLASFCVTENYAMLRSDFLYKMIVRKFENMTKRYQKCLKGARIFLQLNKKIDEEVVIKNLIHFYSDILKADNKQLALFKYVTTSKQIADLYSKILIEFFTLRLNSISSEVDKYYVAEPEGQETIRKIGEKVVYDLPVNFSLTERGIKSEALDIRQTAVLFHFLRNNKATIEYTDLSYSKLVHYFSGHSAENLRKKSGFGNIREIIKETRQGEKYHNAKVVKSLLEKIISDIEEEINK